MIELMVILVFIGIVLVLTIPRFQTGIVTDDLKASTRKMIGLIRGLKDEARGCSAPFRLIPGVTGIGTSRVFGGAKNRARL